MEGNKIRKPTRAPPPPFQTYKGLKQAQRKHLNTRFEAWSLAGLKDTSPMRTPLMRKPITVRGHKIRECLSLQWELQTECLCLEPGCAIFLLRKKVYWLIHLIANKPKTIRFGMGLKLNKPLQENQTLPCYSFLIHWPIFAWNVRLRSKKFDFRMCIIWHRNSSKQSY